jgi:L-asparaginase
MRIQFFSTGGTIDKVYFDAKSEYEVGESNIEKILEMMDVSFDYDYEPIMSIDSLDMKADHREMIYQRIINQSCEDVVITHGTDSMVETMRFLDDRVRESYRVVLTGALRPYHFKNTDAVFNLGTAIASIQMVDRYGAYIAMNGKVFSNEDHPFKAKSGRFE